MKKLKETISPLLNRRRVEYEIEHFQKSTHKKDDLKAQLAKELKIAEDTIYLQNLDRVSPIMSFIGSKTESGPQQLMGTFKGNMKQAWTIVSALITEITSPSPGPR